MERAKGFEPSTSTLARLRSTRLSYARFKKRANHKQKPFECKRGFFEAEFSEIFGSFRVFPISERIPKGGSP
jgi:hypothetical protein